MPGRYAPLPTQQPSTDADRELDEAFGAADEEDDALNQEHQHSFDPTPPALPPLTTVSQLPHCTDASKPDPEGSDGVPAVYDFERDFDYARPPPGSPPRPSAVAVPNNIGNTNGILSTSPAQPSIPRPSFFRRAVGAVLPMHYTRLPTSAGDARPTIWGGGSDNDGVFSNVTAKPSAPVRVRADDSDVFIVPEEEQSVAPPSYASAQADAVPSYWETTVHAPSGLDTGAGMIIEDLPTGTLITFMANLFTSFFFQFVGFLLTYLLHTTHAAKFGSRAGLGLTLIQYGFYSRTGEDAFSMPPTENPPGDQFSDTVYTSTSPNDGTLADENFPLNINSRDWLSFLLMTLGWFILLSSMIGFWRVKRWESSIRATNSRGPLTPEEIERDISTRHNLEQVLGFPLEDEASQPQGPRIPTQRELEEARLQHDLRAAGLL
ncbi:hypothetical protein V8B97DRAFT_1875429 [Scleroderma yunnanense]